MWRLLSIPLALVALLAGAMVWSGGGVEKRADFTFINRGDIHTLDLNQMSYLQDFRVTYGIREGLYTYDPKTITPIPAIAVRHELSADNKVWTFHLRPEAKWSNGNPVTAHDFVFSWAWMLKEPGEYTSLFYYIKNARAFQDAWIESGKDPSKQPMALSELGFEALDDHTLRVTLSNPVPFLLDLLAFPPFYPRHEKSMEDFKEPQPNGRFTYNSRYTRPPHVVTNGPFVLTKWEFKRRLRLERNPHYWDKANVVSDSIEMVVNEQELSQFLQYETGAIDWLASVPPEQAAELKEKGRDKIDLHIVPAFGTEYLTVNCAEQVPGVLDGKNPVSDVRVRQALCMAIDKQALVERVTRMGEKPATTYVPVGTIPGYQQTRPGLPFDAARARRLLAEAGFPNGEGFPAISLLFNSNSPTRRDYCQFLKSQWKAHLNIDVDLRSQESKAYSAAVRDESYILAAAGWYGDYTDPSTFTDKYRRDGGNNNSNWGPQKHEDLLDAAERELDPVRRYDILEEAEAMINEDLPIIPLYQLVNITLYRQDVIGMYDNPKLLTMLKIVGKKKAR